MDINFKDKNILITGATRGIGGSLADIFSNTAANVFLTGTDQIKIDELNQSNNNSQIKWISADFSTEEKIELFLEKIDELSIDICINNAGINIIKPFEDILTSDYEKLLNINLKAPFRIIQTILPKMKKNKFGRIVNISSIWSKVSKSKRSLYSISKTGLVGLTRSLAIENAKYNILVNSISPGFTLTDLTRESLSNSEINSLTKKIPMGRFSEPKEIANIALFLCSHLNSYITGQNIIADGGYTNV